MRTMFEELAVELSKQLVDRGKIVEGGFAGFATTMPNASEHQISDMRIAFFAGAAHLFRSMMVVLDSGEEPTEQDVARMGRINAEVEQFEAWFKANCMKTKGNA